MTQNYKDLKKRKLLLEKELQEVKSKLRKPTIPKDKLEQLIKDTTDLVVGWKFTFQSNKVSLPLEVHIRWGSDKINVEYIWFAKGRSKPYNDLLSKLNDYLYDIFEPAETAEFKNGIFFWEDFYDVLRKTIYRHKTFKHMESKIKDIANIIDQYEKDYDFNWETEVLDLSENAYNNGQDPRYVKR